MSPFLQGLLIYVICAAVLVSIIFATPTFLGTDDYYHARISEQIIQQRRLNVQFPWLPLTILNEQAFVDHHLLFHLYVAPWAAIGGMTGAKLATISIAAGVFLAFWLLLRQVRVSWPAIWTMALFGMSIPFLQRLLMVRAQGAALLILLIALMLLFGRRHRWMILAAFAFTWLYNGFVLLIGFAAAYALAAWIAERRIEWQPVAYTILGIVLGLVINPYFPANIAFILDHLGAKVDLQSSIRVGNEWYPYSIPGLFENSGGALLALVLAFIAPSFRDGKRDRVENTLMFTALITFFMALQSRRFIEYSPAFALLFCAVACGRIPMTAWPPTLSHHGLRRLAQVALVSVAVTVVGLTLPAVYDRVRDTATATDFSGAAHWLAQNSPAGTRVFQTDWDDFPRLFYYNTSNTYLVGLDPTYLQIANPSLWDQWREIVQGEIDNPSAAIQQTFGASYVISDTNHNRFEDQARKDPAMQLVYHDQDAYVWRIDPTSTTSDG
jgi:hypothetical protein